VNLNARNADQMAVSKGADGEAMTVDYLSTLVFIPGTCSQQTRNGLDASTSSWGGVLSFIRSVGRSIQDDLTHPTIKAFSGTDPKPQLELAREGSSNATHEKHA
jgi:hypothetical protein